MEKPIEKVASQSKNKLEAIFLSTRKGMGFQLVYKSSMPDLSAGCILIKENKVLLVLNKKSKMWGFPKGHSDPEDKFLYNTAIRELKEETNIILTKQQLSKGFIRRNNTFYYVILIDKIVSNESEEKDTSEIENMAWFSVDEMVKLPITHHLRSILLPELCVKKEVLELAQVSKNTTT